MNKLLPIVGLLACVATSVSASSPLASQAPLKAAASTPVTGEYVEARTASVFAGACHYNGELDTTGRDAVMAWSITSGSFNGVDLSGVRAVAAVTASENLSYEKVPHRTDLTIDAPSDQQAAALADLLRSRCGNELGTIAAIHRAPVAFSHGADGYTVESKGFATLQVEYRADNSCCIQPNLVWYAPMTPLQQRKVGYTDLASYSGSVADHWQRRGEDSAFYGSFTF
jgi:hypothetical protein